MTPSASEGPDAVLAAERERCAATVDGHLGQLERLLDGTLIYVHATGVVHSRSDYLRYLKEQVRYVEVERRALRLRLYGDAALLDGLMRLAIERRTTGERLTAISFVTQTWLKIEGAWRLASCQSTRAGDDAWEKAARAL